MTSSGQPVRPSGTSSRWWIAGSDTLRISSEQTVMPSWLVASMRVACSIAHSAVFAARDPASARGSICERRAEMTANSAPTKKALTTSSMKSQAMPHQSECSCALPRLAVVIRMRGEAHAVDAAAVEALDAEGAGLDLDGVADHRRGGRARS